MLKITGRMEVLLVSLLVVLYTLTLMFGCKGTEEPPQPGIRYEIEQGAQLQKVSWYRGTEGFLGVEIAVKNVSDSNKAFLIGAKVDDEPTGYDDEGAKTKVEPGKALTVTIYQPVSHVQPKKLWIGVKVLPAPAP